MIQFLLSLLAIAAAISAAVGLVDLGSVYTRANATVFQQISARLDVGLSLIVFAIAAGLAAVIGHLDRLNRSIEQARFTLKRIEIASSPAGGAQADAPASTSAPTEAAPAGRGLNRDAVAVLLIAAAAIGLVVYANTAGLIRR